MLYMKCVLYKCKIYIKYLDCFSLASVINSKHKTHLEPGFLPRIVKVNPISKSCLSSSCCGTMGLAVSWERWIAGSPRFDPRPSRVG